MKQLFFFICLLLQGSLPILAQYRPLPEKPEPKLSLIGGAELVLPVQGGGIYGSLLYHITHGFGVNVNASYDWYTPNYGSRKIATYSAGARLSLSHILFSQFDIGYSYANLPSEPYVYYGTSFRALHIGLSGGVHLENNVELGGELAYGVFTNSNVPNLFFKIKVGYSFTLINKMPRISP